MIRILFQAKLNLSDLTKMMNDLVKHLPTWLAVPTKLPLNILKFERKAGEDPSNHVMLFHLCCSSNSLMDYSIRLRLFHWTLICLGAKRYIELPPSSFVDFGSLMITLLNPFQLSVSYETGMELLTSFQKMTPHIS